MKQYDNTIVPPLLSEVQMCIFSNMVKGHTTKSKNKLLEDHLMPSGRAIFLLAQLFIERKKFNTKQAYIIFNRTFQYLFYYVHTHEEGANWSCYCMAPAQRITYYLDKQITISRSNAYLRLTR